MKSRFHVRQAILRRSMLMMTMQLALAPLAPSYAASCHVYLVNLQGQASIGDGKADSTVQGFNVRQYAVLRDPGVSSNPVEFWLTTQKVLNANPQIGDIEFMTNSMFANNAGIASQRFNLGAVSFGKQSRINFNVDQGMSFVQPSPNVFVAPGIGTAPGGLGGLGFLPGAGQDIANMVNSSQILSVGYMVPRSGKGHVASPDGSWSTITGRIKVTGTPPDNLSFQGRYQANFRGNYSSSFDCN